MMHKLLPFAVSAVLIALPGCNRAPVAVEANSTAEAAESNAPGETPARAPQSYSIPSGTTVPVRLMETLDTKVHRPGDKFTATLDEPLVLGDRVIVPKGTRFNGHVTQAERSGRFKGRALLALRLDSFEMKGRTYAVSTSSPARVSKGHKKRNWLWIGGGSGSGAAIGAAAGGGPGALIGAGAGAAAGTTTALITGRQDVKLPVESRLTFTLRTPVTVA